MGNYVRLVDVATDFANSDRGKELIAELKREQAESPARSARRFDANLLQSHLSADANFGCAMHRFVVLNDMRAQVNHGEDIDRDSFDELYKEYHQYVLDAAEHIRQYHQHGELLDQAIIDEDAQRESESKGQKH